jgi:hypothetical protein
MVHRGTDDVSVGKHPGIVNFATLGKGVGPDDTSVIDDIEHVVAFAVVEEGMLGEAIAG